MIRLTSTLLLILLSATTVFSQSTRERDFDFYYKKASRSISVDLDAAYSYSVEALRLAEKDELWMAYFIVGLIHKKNQEYKKSINFYEKAIESTTSDKNKLYISNNLANVFLESSKLKEATSIILRVKAYNEKLSTSYLYHTYSVLSKIHAKKNNLDSANYYLEKEYQEIEKIKDNRLAKARYLFEKAELMFQGKQIDSAIYYQKESLTIRNKINQKGYPIAHINGEIAKYYLQKNAYKQAGIFLKKAELVKHNHFATKVFLLGIKADYLYQIKDPDQLEEVYTQLENLIQSEGKKLHKKDKDKYNEVKDDVQDKMLLIVQEEKTQTEQKAQLRFIALVVICIVFTAVLIAIILTNRRLQKQTRSFAEYSDVVKKANNEEPQKTEGQIMHSELQSINDNPDKGGIKASELKYRFKVERGGKNNQTTQVSLVERQQETDRVRQEFITKLQGSGFWIPSSE